ncbi:unnamed protein product [Lampetra fluviatilis]
MMKPDISTLSQQLKQERLYVSSERQILQRLNADVLKTAERLYHTAWIGKQQRINLDRLILTSADASPTECCQRAKVLEDTQFVEGYRRLGSHEGMYGELVARLREAPRLVASCLVCGERLGLEGTTTVLQVVYTALYGNGITPQDEAYLLQVLRYLMEFSLKQSDSPRRLLRRATCSFSLLFRLLSDGLAAAKIFLTAALREPILRLLVEDQDRLETDPAKLLDRLEIHTQERLFGPRGTDEFRARVLEAVEVNVTRLVALVNRFASSLRRSTHCFPTVLRWVASQAYVTLARAEGLSPGEARAVCTDLLLACFICPALVNPEQYGVITDAPINEVARFNLMQVGQVLQQLAMLGCEDSDSRMKNIVSRFDRSCVSSFVDVIIGARVLESPPLSSYNLMEGLSRTTVFITAGQLQGMIGFLHAVLAANSLADDDRAWLESLLARLPSQPPLGAGGGTSSGGSSHALCSQGCTPSATPHVSPATTPSSKKNLLQIAAGRSLGRLSVAGGQQPQDCDGDAASGDGYPEEVPEEVLVLSLGASCSDVLPGFMSENEVLSLQVVGGSQGDGGGDEGKLEAEGKPDKTLRFSLCSDNLEGVSEGPSNRSNSVSSLDLEAESVSELGAGASANSDAAALHLLEHEQATTQDNLDDKLRKFEIRDMMGLGDDRDISETVSETWSTDVVGSDFDPNPDEDRLQEIAGTAADSMLGNLLGLPGSGLLERCTGSAMSETTSEAWSVEVLASDSEVTELKQEERLQELESCSGLGSVSDDTDVREVSSRPSTPGLSVVSGISATSEDNPNKTEDLRSECDSDFGGKDSMTSPETEEAGRGAFQLTSSSSQIESILSIFDPLNLADGPPVVRPRIQVSRPEHPSPSEPFLADAAGNAGGGDGQPGHGGQHQTAPALLASRVHSRPARPAGLGAPLGQGLASAARRAPGGEDAVGPSLSWSRRPVNSEEGALHHAWTKRTTFAGSRPTPHSPAPPISMVGCPDDRKDSDDEKSDKSKPWWKKKLSAIQKGPISFKKRDRQDREREDGIMENRFQAIPVVGPQTFAADDILDKYRSAIKRASPSEEQHNEVCERDPSLCCAEAAADGDIFQESPRDEGALSLSADDLPDSASQTALPRHSSFTFRDAKKKLRLALCSADIMAFPLLSAPAVRNGPFPAAEHLDPEDNEIVCFLKVQLAEAIHLQDKSQIAQLQETLRCVARFDNRTCRKLLAAIDDDYRRRAPYIAYLTRCRQGLQATQAHLERTLQRVQRDKDISTRYFTAVCVRLFLERREDRVLAFIDEFKGLTASDEKTAVVSDFLQSLYGAMAQDVIWQHASEEQLQDAQVAIERSIMSRIFRLAFYPNQDGDIMRDQLFHEHIQRLCRVVSANHRALLIPEVYLKEAPWPSAQAEVRTISAYKTPRDKVQCILRTCSTIMNLLSLANEDSVPGADDFVPVLVYVVIKANPPCMLSTVQYINNFYEKRLSGEEQYWWMQFTAAIEFIKTIDDRK